MDSNISNLTELTKLIEKQNINKYKKWDALDASVELAQTDAGVIDFLFSLIDEKSVLADVAAMSLGKIGATKNVQKDIIYEKLFELVTCEENDTKIAAICGLACFNTKATVTLGKTLVFDTEACEIVRINSLSLLEKIGDKDKYELYLKLAKEIGGFSDAKSIIEFNKSNERKTHAKKLTLLHYALFNLYDVTEKLFKTAPESIDPAFANEIQQGQEFVIKTLKAHQQALNLSKKHLN